MPEHREDETARNEHTPAAIWLRRIMGLDFDRVVLAHGELGNDDARGVLAQAWERPLHGRGTGPGYAEGLEGA